MFFMFFNSNMETLNKYTDEFESQQKQLDTYKKEHKDSMCLGINDIIENYVLEKTTLLRSRGRYFRGSGKTEVV